MKKYLLIISLFIFPLSIAFSQSGSFSFGARSLSLGGAAATITDEWSMFNNVGGMVGVKNISAVFGYENRFGTPEFNTIAAGVIIPTQTKWGVAGLSFLRFGDYLYSEQKIGLGYSNRFGLVSLGAQVNYLQYAIESAGNKSTITIDFGGIAEITPQLWIGAHIFNLNQAKLNKAEDEQVPTTMKLGVSYRPTSKLMLNVETEKDLAYPARFKAGIEYNVIKPLYVRTGITSNPFINYFGLGFYHQRFGVDYALTFNGDLGFTHQASIIFHITQRKTNQED